MRDFSYKMQQLKKNNCKNQGKEPGRQKKIQLRPRYYFVCFHNPI